MRTTRSSSRRRARGNSRCRRGRRIARQAHRHDARRRRQHIRRPARLAVDARRSAPPTATSCSTARSARAAASTPITGRTVDFGASDAPLSPDQFTACKGCVQIPWALVGHLGDLQPRRRQEPAAHGRPDPREDLPRQDHELERRRDHEAQPRRLASEPEDRRRPSLGQLRHDVQLHRLPLERQPGVEVGDRHRRRRRTGPSAHGAQRQLRRRRRRRQTPGGIGYVDVAYAQDEPPEVPRDEEPARASSRRRASAGSSRPRRATRSRTPTRTRSRSSTRRRSTRSRTRSRPTPT